MEALTGLLGILIGTILGFLLGRLEKKLEKGDKRAKMAQLLSDEMRSNRDLVQLIKDGIAVARSEGEARPHVGGPFPRDVFTAHVGDLALLEDEKLRKAILDFYGYLAQIQFLVREGYLQRSLGMGSETLEGLQDHIYTGTDAAIFAADNALRELKKLHK